MAVTTTHVIKPLTVETFPSWLALANKHNGVWGGCYCSYFHGDTERTIKRECDGPTFKQRLVGEGVAHAALVFDGEDAIAWCEYGSPLELPNIYHRKQYDAGEKNPAPWRITCFFVDRDHRRSGVAREALDGALDLIAKAGGGEVVSFPNELVPGKKTSSSFLHNGTRAMFEKAGFTFERHIGMHKTVMRKTIAPAPD
ncbi:MAG: GNAT family N-acetyltransferase [Microbacteriaceae bacterium]|nr:GNAT family N-acetyltransferase [Microbacteriaceae bacterium]HOA86084.1 GNAT family N-acetyltransferase [Microbacteriaceae bacterium]HPZ33700.1 GNAT family N-acetyltransferase [Microbacteriaceae bacterium]HQC92912.1 GNAT family N-acetyltransferase [Microbacteriaceae bacterium]